LKRFKRASTLVLALAMILGMLPMMKLAAEAADIAVGDTILHASYAEEGVTVDGKLEEPLYRRTLPLGGALKVSAAWDWTNLTLAFADTAVPAVTEIKVNGQAVTAEGVADTGREIQIPLASVGIGTPDLTKSYALSFKVGEVAWEGKLVFDTSTYATTAPDATGGYGEEFTDDNWTVNMNVLTGPGESSQRWRDFYWPTIANLASSTDAPTIVEMDVTLRYLPDAEEPVAGSKGRDFLMGGLAFTVIDDAPMNGATALEGIPAGLYKNGTDLKLVYWDGANGAYKSIVVDTYTVGKTYHLRLEYSYPGGTAGLNANDNPANDLVNAKYFVNGKLVAEAENVKRNGTYSSATGNKILILLQNTSTAVLPEAESADATVANLSVVKPVAVEAPAGVGDNFLFADYTTDTMTADGKLDETIWRTDIPVADGLRMGAVWNWNSLYLGFNGAANGLTELKINGKAVSAEGVTDSAREIQIPLADIGIEEPDFNKTYSISFKLSGVLWKGVLIFDTRAYAAAAPDNTNTLGYGAEASSDGWTVVLNSYDGSGTQNQRDLYFPTIAELASSLEAATIVEMDVKVDQLPDAHPYYAPAREFFFGALDIVVVDDVDLAGTTSAKEGMFTCLYRTGDKVYLVYWDNTKGEHVEAEIGAYEVGKTYHLRIEYSYTAGDGTTTDNNDIVAAKYFVDGKLVAEAASVKRFGCGITVAKPNTICIQAQDVNAANANATEATSVKATVSKLSVTKTQIIGKPSDLLNLTPGTIFGDIDLNHVTSDLPLVSSFTGLSGASYPLTWITGDASIVAADGKITPHDTEIKSTTITLKVEDQELWTVTVKLAPLTEGVDYESPKKAEAAFTASPIIVDGVLNEEGWRMSGRVLNNKMQIFAEYGFQWNQTTLFVAVQFLNGVDTLALSLNGNDFTVKDGKLMMGNVAVVNAQVAVKDGVVEMAIPMQVIGMGQKVSEYGKSMKLAVVAGGFTGAGETLALTGVDWFATDNRGHLAETSGMKGTDKEHGVDVLENGYRMYDLYKEGGNNVTEIRTYVIYNKISPYLENFTDRTYATRVEFDFLAAAMPLQDENHFNSSAFSNSGFSFSLGELCNDAKEAYTMVCGIMNTVNGLEFVLQGVEGYIMVPLNKTVGQKFSFAVEWYQDGYIKIFVDGELVKTLQNATKYTVGVGNASLCINMKRVKYKPTSSADDFDVYMTNLAMGKVHNEEDILQQLTFEDFKGSNTAQNNVTADLSLPATITNGQLDVAHPITWQSSSAAIDAKTGKVTRPAKGVAIVTLTASLPNGEVKSFEVVVAGLEVSNEGVLHVNNDRNPAAGKGVPSEDTMFTLDANNNSIIRVLDAKQKVNYVVLTDGNDKARLNAESLTLWVSDDNVTYKQVESFKLLQVNEKWYLYDFEAEGKYVKVHYTHYIADGANFTGAYGEMIHAGFETVFGGGEATFTDSEYTVTNNGATKYDYAWTISKEALGITGSDASIRIYLNGELLYHYVDGKNVIVRIPEVAAGASVKLTVKQSQSADVLNIANKENVYEVTYGNRETVLISRDQFTRWPLTLPAGTKFPDGTVLEKETIYAAGDLYNNSGATMYWSTDGGRTWEGSPIVNNAPAGKTPVTLVGGGGGMNFDSVTGRIFFHTYWGYGDGTTPSFVADDMNKSHLESFVTASDDGGKTWYVLAKMPCACEEGLEAPETPRYSLSYSEGLMLSTYDGKDGDGVDFVYPMGAQYDNRGTFATRVAYSRDAGETWQYSKTLITYHSDGIEHFAEGGCSEAMIVEREDGILVLHARCQSTDSYHFKVAYSFDKGVTWTNGSTFTDYYAPNTQPWIEREPVNGEDAFLSIWAGNNVVGGESYLRNPLNVAVSANDGETFRNIQNLFFKTHMEGYSQNYFGYVTNQSFTKYGDGNAMLTFSGLLGHYIGIYVQDFDQWLTRTKGAYDDFEHGTVQYEGWVTNMGKTELSTLNTQGKYSMKVNAFTNVTRSVPYLQDGKVSIDIFVAADSSFNLALQSAYSPRYTDQATPIRMRVEAGKLYLADGTQAIGDLKEGWNTLTFDLELTKDKAALAINDGAFVNIPMAADADDYVCYITLNANSVIYVDELLVISELDAVVAASDADKAAADKVIELIKAIEKADDKADAVKAARKAFDALTQTQADLVNRKHPVNAEADSLEDMVNYYEILVAQEAKYGKQIVEAVIEKINAIGTVTVQSKEAIEAARAAYDALTAEQKKLIENYETLTKAEAKLKELQSELDKAAVDAVEDKIAAIGTVTLQSKDAIKAARAAYDKLTAEQKAQVSNYKALTDAEAALKALEEAGDVIPPTGDTAPIAVMMSALVISLLAVAVLVPDIRRKWMR